eukprot:COSAG05_NODE_1550_length_4581_cov_2.287595_3_plen_52_part_00
MLQVKIFVLELLAVDADASRPISLDKVPALYAASLNEGGRGAVNTRVRRHL